jgi:hypothetical protein
LLLTAPVYHNNSVEYHISGIGPGLDASPSKQTLVFVPCLHGIGHRTTPIIAIQIQHRIIPIRCPRTAIRAIIPIAPREETVITHPPQTGKYNFPEFFHF